MFNWFRKIAPPRNDTEAMEAALQQLRPRPVPLPAIGGQQLFDTSQRFAFIVMLYAKAKGMKTDTPAELSDAARAATAWYHGVES